MTIQRMIDLVKIELQCVTRKACTNCYGCELCDLVQDDAELQNMYCSVIEALEAQTPRILTREEMEDAEPGNVVWLEQRDEVRTYLTPMIKYDDGMFENKFLGASPEAVGLANTRFWSAKPTDEQRKAAAWHEA